MAKTSRARSLYRCAECGHTCAKWLGRCPECGSWGGIDPVAQAAAPSPGLQPAAPARPAVPI
ncbi:MAG: DNA repair protein RadA, partial [Mycolicibacter sinensis]